jgi:hypothetical protein
VAQQTSRRHSTFRQVCCSIISVTESQAAVICRRSSSTSCTFVWNIKPFMYLHRKKSKGFKSGDLGGHAIGFPLPIHLPGNCWSKKSFHWVAYARPEVCERKLGNFPHLYLQIYVSFQLLLWMARKKYISPCRHALDITDKRQPAQQTHNTMRELYRTVQYNRHSYVTSSLHSRYFPRIDI